MLQSAWHDLQLHVTKRGLSPIFQIYACLFVSQLSGGGCSRLPHPPHAVASVEALGICLSQFLLFYNQFMALCVLSILSVCGRTCLFLFARFFGHVSKRVGKHANACILLGTLLFFEQYIFIADRVANCFDAGEINPRKFSLPDHS